MKYMLLIYLDEQVLEESERQQCYVDSAQLAQELNSSGGIWPPTRSTPSRRQPASGYGTAEGW